MTNYPSHGLFITGTDTEIGKTYVTALIAKALVASGRRVGVYKPAASGCSWEGERLVSHDARALWEAAGRPETIEMVCPQLFEAPLAPHLAARAEGKELDEDLLRAGAARWTGKCDVLLVEGAGGLMSPLGEEEYNADLAFDLGYPLVVVAPNILGVINQTLQTLITAATFREGLDIAGVVLNDVVEREEDVSMGSNRRELETRCVPPLLAHVKHGAGSIEASIDWMARAKIGS